MREPTSKVDIDREISASLLTAVKTLRSGFTFTNPNCFNVEITRRRRSGNLTGQTEEASANWLSLTDLLRSYFAWRFSDFDYISAANSHA